VGPAAHPIRIGVGGWTYEPWRKTFYPDGLSQKKELEYASRKLTAIEINGTFYRTQKPETFQKWASETPDGFVFSLKAHRFSTSRKTEEEMKDSIAHFLNSGVTALGDRLGPINWQFPPHRKFDADYFGAFFRNLPPEHHGVRLRHAIETRHDSFNTTAFDDLLSAHNLACVFADDPDWPAPDRETADFAYARLQCSREEFETGYPADELDGWAKTFKGWAEKREVFAFLISGAKHRDPAGAMALIERLGGRP
jgi:uncharacterized protein YecE (DUF72 family)